MINFPKTWTTVNSRMSYNFISPHETVLFLRRPKHLQHTPFNKKNKNKYIFAEKHQNYSQILNPTLCRFEKISFNVINGCLCIVCVVQQSHSPACLTFPVNKHMQGMTCSLQEADTSYPEYPW